MLKIDTHQHFWKFDPVKDSWITDQMGILKRDYLPEDLEPELNENRVDGCIVVQSDQSEYENHFQLVNAENHAFIKAVVGWVDFTDSNINQRLEYYYQFKKLKGFRHVLQGEAQRDFMLRPDFLNGISLLKNYGFTYDILVYPDQLRFVKELVAKFPEQRFVIDHIAKPYIKEKKISEWGADMMELGKYKNLFCKVSGMVTETNWNKWTVAEFKPYIDTVVQSFGMDRIMFGSDWPVCTLSATYGEVLGIVNDYFAGYNEIEREKFFGKNAVEFYNL
jgi:L-fuconolactonase